MTIFRRKGEDANFTGVFAGYLFEDGLCHVKETDPQVIEVARNLLVRFNGCEEVGAEPEESAEEAQGATEDDAAEAEAAEAKETPRGRNGRKK